MNKKYLPFIIVIILGVVFVAGVFIIRTINQPASLDNSQVSDQGVPDLPQDQRPTAELIPSSDGHYIDIRIKDIKVPNASSMDYELTWNAVNQGVDTTQGTSSTVQLNSQSTYEKNNILGSESSGKRRFDQGVEKGKLTLRFRNSSGKLIGKVSTDWHMQTDTTNLSSVDGSFKYTLDKAADGVWFITMQPFGTPSQSDVIVFAKGWAIYASDGKPHSGKVQ